jgi:hypothetical protein
MKIKKQIKFKELPLEVGKTYQTKWATKEGFTVTKDHYIRDKKGKVTGEGFRVQGIFEGSPELGVCPLNVDRLIFDKVKDGTTSVCSNCNEELEGSSKFKTLITPNGEFGILDLDIDPNDRLFIGTSSTPMLLQPDVTLDHIKKNYNGMLLSRWDMEIDTDEKWERFDWESHTPDWKLVEIDLTISK